MKRHMPFADQVNISSSSDDEAPSNAKKDRTNGKRLKKDIKIICPTKAIVSEATVTKSAKMYQEYMQQIPIPHQRESVIPFTSWTGLAKSMKHLYQQPLHYLTNLRIKQWDQMRIDDEENAPLDSIIHPCKAETNIWLMEELHRLTASHQFLAKLWLADPMYYTFIDSVFPVL